MAYADGSYLTQQGIELIAKLLASNGSLTFTKATIGSGTLPAGIAPDTMTDLVNYEAVGMISSVIHSGNEAAIIVQVSSTGLTVGFSASELMLYADDPDVGEIAYTYLVLADRPEWIRPEDDPITKIASFTLIAVVGNVAEVKAIIDPDAFASADALNHEVQARTDGDTALGSRIDNIDPLTLTAPAADSAAPAAVPTPTPIKTILQTIWNKLKHLYDKKADLGSDGKILQSQIPTISASVPDATTTVKGIATLGASGGAARYGQKADVGLSNVDNTSDASKPVSTAQNAAISAKVAKAGDYMSGQLTIAKAQVGTGISNVGGMGQFEINNGGVSTSASGVTFHRTGEHAVNFGLDIDNQLKVGGFSMGANAYLILHTGNNGARMFTGTLTIPVGWNAGAFGSNYYWNVVTFAGILTTDQLIIEPNLPNNDTAAGDLIQAEWNKVAIIQYYNVNQIIVLVKEPTTIAIPLQWVLLR